MGREINWEKIPAAVRHNVAIGEAHRFRIWQAIKKLGAQATTADLVAFTGFSKSTIFRHLHTLDFKPRVDPSWVAVQRELLPCDLYCRLTD